MALAINISHQCLVRSGTFIGTCRLLAGLFTVFSRRPIVNQLGVNGRNRFKITMITTEKNKSYGSVFCVVFYDIIDYAELRNVVVPACK